MRLLSLKNWNQGYLSHNFPDISLLVFGNWFQNWRLVSWQNHNSILAACLLSWLKSECSGTLFLPTARHNNRILSFKCWKVPDIIIHLVLWQILKSLLEKEKDQCWIFSKTCVRTQLVSLWNSDEQSLNWRWKAHHGNFHRRFVVSIGTCFELRSIENTISYSKDSDFINVFLQHTIYSNII